MDFGAFVEIFPGTDGLLHISQISEKRVNKVTDEVQEGDQILVKVLEVDRSGRIKLSHKEAVKEREMEKIPKAEDIDQGIVDEYPGLKVYIISLSEVS